MIIYGYHLLDQGFKEGDIIDLTLREGGIVKGPIKLVRNGSFVIVDNTIRNGGLFTLANTVTGWVNPKVFGINSLSSPVELHPVIEDELPNYNVVFTYTDQHGINRREHNTYTGKDAHQKAMDFMTAKIWMQNDAPIDAIWIEKMSVIHYVDTMQSYPVVN